MTGNVDVEEEGGGQSGRASPWVLSELWGWEEGTWEGLEHESDLIFLKEHWLLSREMNTVGPLNPQIQPTSDGKDWGSGSRNLRRFQKASQSSILNPCK